MKNPVALRVLTVVGALTLFAAATPAAADDHLPTAREVVDRYVEAINAREALEDVESIKSTGTFSIPAQGMQGELTMWQKAPDKMLTRITLSGIGEIEQGYDGEVGWSIDPMQGAMLLSGAMLDQVRDQANFRGMLYEEDDIDTLEMVGETEFQGEPAYEIRVVSTTGLETTQFFSVESGLLIGQKMEQQSPMGAVPVTQVIGDYQEFGGLLLPTTSTDRMMGMEQKMEITSISVEPIDDSVFAVPAEIEALAEPE
jgi:hypothetical protein